MSQGVVKLSVNAENITVDPADYDIKEQKSWLNPLLNQDLATNFKSFQDFAHELEDDLHKLSPEDFKRLEHLQRVLNREEVVEYNYKEHFQNASLQLQNVMNSKFPIQIKTKLAESIRDTLQTKLKCLIEVKTLTKEMIIQVEKMNNYSTYLNLIQRWKESHKHTRSFSTASTDVNSYAVNSTYTKNGSEERSRKRVESIISNQSGTEELSEEQKALEEMSQDIFKLEDVIASLKETRNFLIIAMDNSKDDMAEYQEFVQSKNNILQEKLKRIEELKSKISAQSAKRSTNIRHANKIGGSETERVDKSISRTNNSVFHDVSSKLSSKVTGLFGKVFGGKGKQTSNDKVLSPDFLREVNLQTLSNDNIDPDHKYKYREPLSTKSVKK